MTRLNEIASHIHNIDELQDVIGAMRSLAATRLQEAQHALPGARRFGETMAAAIGSALLLLPAVPTSQPSGRSRRAMILLTAEHGFVGGFNERLVDALEATRRPEDVLFVLGSRGAAHVAERIQQPDWSNPIATRCVSVPSCIRNLVSELYSRIGRGEITRVELIYARYRQGNVSTVEHHSVVPVDLSLLKTKTRTQPPLHNLKPAALIDELVAEYVFAVLTEAAIESLSSENAARFAAMDSARDNVSKKATQLKEELQRARQSEITTELLDLITGSEALTGSSSIRSSSRTADMA